MGKGAEYREENYKKIVSKNDGNNVNDLAKNKATGTGTNGHGGLDTICLDTWEWKDVIWMNVYVITVWHIGAAYGLYKIINGQVGFNEYLFQHIAMWYISGLGVTAGAHRLWSHRAFKAKTPLRVFLMLANSAAFQKTICDWSRDHRTHHKGSETSSDPHNAKRGFFFAHMGWCFLKKNKEVIAEGKKIDYSDLLDDPVIQFQNKYFLWLVLSCCYLFPAIVGHLVWGNFWNGIFVGGFFRHCWYYIQHGA